MVVFLRYSLTRTYHLHDSSVFHINVHFKYFRDPTMICQCNAAQEMVRETEFVG